MADLFGIDVAGIVLDTHGSSYLDATLHVTTIGTRTPGDLAAGTNPTTTNYTCKGLIVDYSPHELGDLVTAGDRRIQLLARSIAFGTIAPKPSDQITIGGTKYTIAPEEDAVTHDPAVAVYECRARA